jgi:hypothetical protein
MNRGTSHQPACAVGLCGWWRERLPVRCVRRASSGALQAPRLRSSCRDGGDGGAAGAVASAAAARAVVVAVAAAESACCLCLSRA